MSFSQHCETFVPLEDIRVTFSCSEPKFIIHSFLGCYRQSTYNTYRWQSFAHYSCLIHKLFEKLPVSLSRYLCVSRHCLHEANTHREDFVCVHISSSELGTFLWNLVRGMTWNWLGEFTMGLYQLREAHTSQDVEFKIQRSRTLICPEDGGSRLF